MLTYRHYQRPGHLAGALCIVPRRCHQPFRLVAARMSRASSSGEDVDPAPPGSCSGGAPAIGPAAGYLCRYTRTSISPGTQAGILSICQTTDTSRVMLPSRVPGCHCVTPHGRWVSRRTWQRDLPETGSSWSRDRDDGRIEVWVDESTVSTRYLFSPLKSLRADDRWPSRSIFLPSSKIRPWP